MDDFQPGYNCPIVFIPIGLDGIPDTGQILQVTSHTGDFTGLLVSVKHTGTQGHEARVGCGDDFRATINADYDMDLPPYADPPSIFPQQPGVLRQYIGLDTFNQWGVRVSRLHFAIDVNNVTKYSFDVEMDWLTHAYSLGMSGPPSITITALGASAQDVRAAALTDS